MRLREDELLNDVQRLVVRLYGSLGATGRGHGSGKAVILGLEGEQPETVDIERIDARMTNIKEQASLSILGDHPIAFDFRNDLVFEKRESLPGHPNGMRFVALARTVSQALTGAPDRQLVEFVPGSVVGIECSDGASWRLFMFARPEFFNRISR